MRRMSILALLAAAIAAGFAPDAGAQRRSDGPLGINQSAQSSAVPASKQKAAASRREARNASKAAQKRNARSAARKQHNVLVREELVHKEIEVCGGQALPITTNGEFVAALGGCNGSYECFARVIVEHKKTIEREVTREVAKKMMIRSARDLLRNMSSDWNEVLDDAAKPGSAFGDPESYRPALTAIDKALEEAEKLAGALSSLSD